MTAETQRPIRLAIVDDYEVVVRGLADMFSAYTDRVEVVELDADKPVRAPVDIVLYDTFAMPQGESVELDGLVEGGSPTKVVVYTWNAHHDLVEATLAKGAAAYLPKSLTARELVDSLERVHRGEQLRPGSDTVNPLVGGQWPGREEGLSQREAEVIALITQGFSNQEIAEQTYLSMNSIKTYIRTAYRKMGVSSRTQAVLWGVDHGFSPDRMRIT